jgi:starch phosphorylase
MRMLSLIPTGQLEAAAADPDFLRLYDGALAALGDARRRPEHPGGWRGFRSTRLRSSPTSLAEFALHQSLPIYAGGLGAAGGRSLQGKRLISASADRRRVHVSAGLLSPAHSAEGWQEESYEHLIWADAPIEQATTPTAAVRHGGAARRTNGAGGRSGACAWGGEAVSARHRPRGKRAPWDRELSARLYGGDRETRIQQEILLGIGGVRALKALGSTPAVFHLNEGHAAFVVLQRIRDLIENGSTFDQALEEIRATTVFTTHTPVAAGHDAFPFQLVEKHLAGCWGTLGANRGSFLALGSHDAGGGPQFNMTALRAVRPGAINAVSQFHGEVT